MGSRIAAHFANAGFPVTLLDVVTPAAANRNAAALAGIDAAAKGRPGAFFTASAAGRITPGNFEDDITRLRDCDWIVEAVAEDLEIKRSLLYRIAAVRVPGTILSTNTSGLPLASLAEGFGDEFRSHFLGTHFFNPPRYLHLVEVIPGAATAREVLEFVTGFCDRRLGKGVVPCKDTPNFIANRIGSFFGATIHKLTCQGGYTIAEVDTLTGPLIGLPKSASYRLMDIVGLDVWQRVTANLHDLVPHDPWRDRYVLPDFMMRMIERGWLGDKRGQGFYRRVKQSGETSIHVIDRETLEYQPVPGVAFDSVAAARKIDDLPRRLRTLSAADDRAGSFLWSLFSDLFLYSASLIPEISDRIVEVDRAMRWGYAHTLGPFELWDALGVEETVLRLHGEGREVPENVRQMLAGGAASFYQEADRGRDPGTRYFDLRNGVYAALEPRPGVLVLADLKRARGVVQKNASASLIDLDNGVLCLEFHSRMNTIGDDVVSMIRAALDETARNFLALVIANQGEQFSSGLNLQWLLGAAQAGRWEEIEGAAARLQQANLAIKYALRPVVAAPFGSTLGAGCALALHAARIQAFAETSMGFTEAALGLIPAGGGCKELLLRLGSARAAFDLIAAARVSASAAEAGDLGLLRHEDEVTMNPARLPGDAKTAALALAPEWTPGGPRTDIPVEGTTGFASLKLAVYMAREGNYISGYDAEVGEMLALVLCGGRLSGPSQVTEQYLLDLEREAFLSLCGNPRTQERIAHTLQTGKPMRN